MVGRVFLSVLAGRCYSRKTQVVEVYQPNEDVLLLTIENTLDGYDVLPGFSLPIAEIFKV